MSTDEKAFVEGLFSILPAMRDVYTDALADFYPDDPPIIVLLGAFGRNIAHIEGTETGLIDQRLFDYIEDGVRTHGKLRDAVITGFIEAMHNCANAEGSWHRIRERLGVQSLELAESW